MIEPSKLRGIIEVDVPKACEWCGFICSHTNRNASWWYCGINKHVIPDYSVRSPYCPIKPVPITIAIKEAKNE